MNQSIINISKSTVYVILLMFFIACQNQAKENTTTEDPHHEEGLIHLSKKQFDALGLRVDKMVKRNLNAFVETNGQLTLPPQSEASVSAVIGANITQIKVIEGDRIKKGQVLAISLTLIFLNFSPISSKKPVNWIIWSSNIKDRKTFTMKK